MADYRIETATPKDSVAIMALVRFHEKSDRRYIKTTTTFLSRCNSLFQELAEFEKYPEGVKITEEVLAKDLERKAVEGLLVWEGDSCVAMVLYFYAYSTWEGQFLHMEDLYVQPQHRRKGYGKKLWAELGKIAQERGCRRFQWNVLNWNTKAIEFYKSMPYIDLTTSEGWLWFRLDTEGIKKLADSMK